MAADSLDLDSSARLQPAGRTVGSMAKRRMLIAVAGVVVLPLVGTSCGSDDASSSAGTTTTSSRQTTTSYAPAIDPSSFSTTIDNTYLPMRPGTTYFFEGTEEGEAQRNEVYVTGETKVVQGVTCVVVHDVVYVNDELAEDTFDWYAQDDAGAVWYFGERTKELNPDGSTKSTEGSWEAGVDGAQPGIVMPAMPAVGDTYRQEYRKGEAEDMATVLQLDATVAVPEGTYNDVVVTKDFTPLEPDIVEHKRYAPGVGFVSSDLVEGGQEHVELVRIGHE